MNSLNNLFSFPPESKSGNCVFPWPGLEGYGILKDYASREFNVLLWVSLVTITALLIEKVFKLFRLWAKGSRIPGPPRNSFFRHRSFGSRDNFINVLAELHDKYGSLIKLWLGPALLLVSIKDPVLIKELLLKAEDKLPFTGKAFRLAFGRSSLFFCSYDQARKRRESLALELNEKLTARANVISKNVVDSIRKRIDDVMSKGSIDCKLVSQHMAFMILGTMLFGDAFLSSSKATSYEELLMTIAKDASFWASYRVTPFWKRGFWKYQSLCAKLKCLTQDIVQQCSKNYKPFGHMDESSRNGTAKVGKKTAYGVVPPSGVVMPGKIFPGEFDGHINAREETCGNIMGVMFHGCIATAGLIDNILERFAREPELQDKIYSEISMARQGSVKEGHNLDNMLLLLATIYESARLLPAGPLLQRCSLKYDLNLKNGVIIPTGAIVVVPAQLLQLDNSSWGSDASKFNPYRFLSKPGKILGLMDTSLTDAEGAVNPIQSSFILNDPNENAAFLPFGSGIRACVGQKFVIQGVATLFASLLECYEVRLQPGLENGPKSAASPGMVFVRRNN